MGKKVIDAVSQRTMTAPRLREISQSLLKLADSLEQTKPGDAISLKEMGKLVRSRREANKMSMETAAEVADISLTTLQNIELSKGVSPKIKTVQALGDLLGFDVMLVIR
ncbi:hypothetical protein BTA51_23860 [Hahella sp. CCB-MM4]|uniref:helix-turn-helix domain-containing protein n=1 Tax=Hahella sp. (strain CCB-MM4) TaxID=1926491 RepID=UPI000B9B964B|nr:helix-turn-helix transcriptional regulator [Hahella sp. CCB-MM4]OZG70876.1 hypothetical protein BTA51_23860 [Hahella sp. CCB-MM4]